MTIEDVKKYLELISEYKIRYNSIKSELEISEGTPMYNRLKNELEEITDKMVYVRSCINDVKGSKIRKILTLRYVDGCTFVEIAKTLNLTTQWVQELHKKGLQQLSDIM